MALNNGKVTRRINYVNKDFSEIRQELINYTKNYFPNTYSDFNESSPGMHMLELAAYVGDIMGFYTDVQLQESFLSTVSERINLYNLAQTHGYKVKTVTPSSVDIDIFQIVPSIGEGTDNRPDYNYALSIDADMQLRTDDNIYFRTTEPADFSYSSSLSPTIVSVKTVSDDGNIEFYLLKKTVKAVSGRVATATYDFEEAKIYDKIVLPDFNVSEIIDIVDSDNNIWYEVPFMAQDLVQVGIRNTPYADPVLHQYASTVPYLLSYKQTDKRFVTRVRKDDRIEIQFGSGLSSESDEEIVPNPFNVGIGLDYYNRATEVSIDPMNFLYTKTYGTAPTNTTLTVRYSIANGLSDNVNSNTIVNIVSSTVSDPAATTDPTILDSIKSSIVVTNPNPAFGGQTKKPFDVVREEAMANFAAQNRSVTKEDYILRCFTMPSKYGSVAKAYVEQDTQISRNLEFERTPNPYALNLYILTYSLDKTFVTANEAIKENLRTYLRNYRLMTDAVAIKDPWIINISISYEIITYPNQNSNEVLLRCTNKLIELFDNDKMEINKPIVLSNLYSELDRIEGVQTVQNITINNEYDTALGYSGNYYDIVSATRSNIIYPSLDPSIFEVKFKTRDIKGRVNDI